jgi:hypothetical protein
MASLLDLFAQVDGVGRQGFKAREPTAPVSSVLWVAFATVAFRLEAASRCTELAAERPPFKYSRNTTASAFETAPMPQLRARRVLGCHGAAIDVHDANSERQVARPGRVDFVKLRTKKPHSSGGNGIHFPFIQAP